MKISWSADDLVEPYYGYSCYPIIAKGFWQRPARKLGNYREIHDFTLSREYAWRKFLSEKLALWLIIYECSAVAASSLKEVKTSEQTDIQC